MYSSNPYTPYPPPSSPTYPNPNYPPQPTVYPNYPPQPQINSAGGYNSQGGYPPSVNPNPNPPPNPLSTSQSWYAPYYNSIGPQEMVGLQAWFTRVDLDRSGTIEAEELQQVTFDRIPIGIEAARKLVQVFDKDRNGKIDFVEYASMHKFIAHMRQVFMHTDTDRTGRLDQRKILTAFSGAGFSYITTDTINELLRKFDKTRMGLGWHEFLMMAAHVALVHSVFQWNDIQRKGVITLTADQLTHISAFLL